MEDNISAHSSFSHVPVLLKEATSALLPKANGKYIDGTFGAGGYSQEILSTKGTCVLGIDRDETAFVNANPLIERFSGRLKVANGCFSNMEEIAKKNGFDEVDGVVLDIGVSSMQIDDARRGFSFMKNGELDMRMDQAGIKARDIVNTYKEAELADIIYTFGEERKSRQIASAIVARRKVKPFETTLDLADIVCSVVKRGKDKIHPATRTFQALRIFVNDELGELEKGLIAATSLLKDDGRLAVVTFHSLEDAIVKKFMNEKAGKKEALSRYAPAYLNLSTNNNDYNSLLSLTPKFKKITKKPITPTLAEIANNPRSRSAKLRVLAKLPASNLSCDNKGSIESTILSPACNSKNEGKV